MFKIDFICIKKNFYYILVSVFTAKIYESIFIFKGKNLFKRAFENKKI